MIFVKTRTHNDYPNTSRRKRKQSDTENDVAKPIGLCDVRFNTERYHITVKIVVVTIVSNNRYIMFMVPHIIMYIIIIIVLSWAYCNIVVFKLIVLYTRQPRQTTGPGMEFCQNMLILLLLLSLLVRILGRRQTMRRETTYYQMTTIFRIHHTRFIVRKLQRTDTKKHRFLHRPPNCQLKPTPTEIF